MNFAEDLESPPLHLQGLKNTFISICGTSPIIYVIVASDMMWALAFPLTLCLIHLWCASSFGVTQPARTMRSLAFSWFVGCKFQKERQFEWTSVLLQRLAVNIPLSKDNKHPCFVAPGQPPFPPPTCSSHLVLNPDISNCSSRCLMSVSPMTSPTGGTCREPALLGSFRHITVS